MQTVKREMTKAKIEHVKTEALIPYARNSRTHSEQQVAQIAASIREWAIISDYAVSKCGVILRLPFETIGRWGGKIKMQPKILAQSDDKDGYKLVTMRRLGWTKNGQIRVHRLIAHCWIGQRQDGMEINHIDGNKANNAASNLEYVTSSQNKAHALRLGLMKTGKGHHATKPVKLTKNGQVVVLNGSREISDFGLLPQNVHRVARGERKHIKGWKAEYV